MCLSALLSRQIMCNCQSWQLKVESWKFGSPYGTIESLCLQNRTFSCIYVVVKLCMDILNHPEGIPQLSTVNFQFSTHLPFAVLLTKTDKHNAKCKIKNCGVRFADILKVFYPLFLKKIPSFCILHLSFSIIPLGGNHYGNRNIL